MSTLSLCVICKNEEKTLGRLLKSVKGPLFDEIIIVDTGSTDNTIKIAREYTDQVHFFKWINDFSAARNYSFSKATKEYIFWLDADDEIKPLDYQKLLDLKPKLIEADIHLLKYEYAHDEFDKSICSFFRERIVKRSLNLQWQDPIHEYLPLTGILKKHDIEVHHYKQSSSIDRNIPMLEKLVLKQPDNARNMYYLGKEYFDSGQEEKGVMFLKKFVQMNGAWDENLYQAYLKIASYYQSQKKFSLAEESCFSALSKIPLKAEAYYKLGELALNQNLYTKAMHWFKITSNLERPDDALDMIEPKYYTWLPHLQLCVTYNSLGKIEEAALHNEIAASYLPQDIRMINNRDILKRSLKEKYIYDQYPISKNIYEFYKNLSLLKSNFSQPKSDLESTNNLESSNKKIGWCVPRSMDAGTIRIRTLNIQKSLKNLGYISELCVPEDTSKFDIIIMGKTFSSSDLALIKSLKAQNKKVLIDLSEDILEYPLVTAILKECTAVICCSEELRKKVLPYNERVFLIEDATEHELFMDER